MLSFIRRHWVAYTVGAALALLLGFGAAWFVALNARLLKTSVPNASRQSKLQLKPTSSLRRIRLAQTKYRIQARRSKHISVKKR